MESTLVQFVGVTACVPLPRHLLTPATMEHCLKPACLCHVDLGLTVYVDKPFLLHLACGCM